MSAREMSLYVKTPLIYSLPLSRAAGASVWLKLESMQPSGSFKDRGMSRICSHYAGLGAKGFVSSSGGNAGLAVAYSGLVLGVPVKVVVPETTSPYMRGKIERMGAEVIVHGKNWNESDPVARRIAEEEEMTYYIPPFDHPLIWEGNRTMMLEVAEEGLVPDVVVLAVGGGGLFCGAVLGMEETGLGKVPVVAVETEGAASFARAIEKGEVVTLSGIRTIAKSLGATRVSEQGLEWTKKRPVISEVVTDREALDGVLRFAEDHRILVEPAAGAALSLAYHKKPVLSGCRNILVVVCGGSGVCRSLIDEWEREVPLL